MTEAMVSAAGSACWELPGESVDFKQTSKPDINPIKRFLPVVLTPAMQLPRARTRPFVHFVASLHWAGIKGESEMDWLMSV